MKLNVFKILDKANALYVQKKIIKGEYSYSDVSPTPKIRSDQVLSLLEALVEEINASKENR